MLFNFGATERPRGVKETVTSDDDSISPLDMVTVHDTANISIEGITSDPSGELLDAPAPEMETMTPETDTETEVKPDNSSNFSEIIRDITRRYPITQGELDGTNTDTTVTIPGFGLLHILKNGCALFMYHVLYQHGGDISIAAGPFREDTGNHSTPRMSDRDWATFKEQWKSMSKASLSVIFDDFKNGIEPDLVAELHDLKVINIFSTDESKSRYKVLFEYGGHILLACGSQHETAKVLKVDDAESTMEE